MDHDWFKNGEIRGNVLVECRQCGYKTSAGYSQNPNMNWFIPGRFMPDMRRGYSEVRPIPRCSDYLMETIHDR
jgi:hypothetical protein